MKELYILLKQELLKGKTPFICNNIELLDLYAIITKAQYRSLMNHFKSQFPKPNLHPEFYNNPLFNAESGGGVWFKHSECPEQGVQIRIDFLDKIISTL